MSRLLQTLQPDVLRWARERVGLAPADLARKLGVKPDTVLEWERSGQLSGSQADRLAHKTYTPLGFLYLPEPPDESLPIPDFRMPHNHHTRQPSPDLLETVYVMQRRQSWMREEMIENGDEPISFTQYADLKNAAPQKVADAMRATLKLSPHWAAEESSWSNAIRCLRDSIEKAGILLFFNGVVGNNTHRKLNPKEFQGFALVDEYAPLIFINNSDFKAAQMFTLAHELAHLFIAEEGVSHFEAMKPADNETERRCDRIAAEFLVPEKTLRAFWIETQPKADPYQTIAERFKVSVLVAARRALDLGLIQKQDFFKFYDRYKQDQAYRKRYEDGGGTFWNNQNVRIGRRFGCMVVRAAQEGRLPYREAYALTGLKSKTFDSLIEKMGV